MTIHPPMCQLFDPKAGEYWNLYIIGNINRCLLLEFVEEIKPELKKLCGVMLHQYLATLDTLVKTPDGASSKIRELQLITENIHYLLNQCRPHQARAVLLLIMKLKNQARIDSITSIQWYLNDLYHFLKLSNLFDNSVVRKRS